MDVIFSLLFTVSSSLPVSHALTQTHTRALAHTRTHTPTHKHALCGVHMCSPQSNIRQICGLRGYRLFYCKRTIIAVGDEEHEEEDEE